MSNRATLIIASSEADSNLYYATHFLVPDPIIYYEMNGRKYLVLSDLELDRAKIEAQVHQVISLSAIYKLIKKKMNPSYPKYTFVIDYLFKKKHIKNILVPSNFPAEYYEAFHRLKYKIQIKQGLLFEQRLIKSENEKNLIRHSALQVERALQKALLILEKSKIKRNKIFYGRELVTSEMLRSVINIKLMELGCVAVNTIVASGKQSSFPHHEGSGPLIPHTPIIIDIYPRHAKTRYFADMTRTVVKGKPDPYTKKMYEAVYKANQRATSQVRANKNTAEIHQIVLNCFKECGFNTGKMKGRMQGFIHSTGHGLGLDIHEPPSVSAQKYILKKGNVITIEPGLYYEKYGGIRLEDDVYVTKNGCEKLTKFPKFFEIDKGK